MFKRIIYIIILLLNYQLVAGQDGVFEKLVREKRWTEGSLLTIDGDELIGLISYDPDEEFVHFKTNEGSLRFRAGKIKAFEFDDEVLNKQRVFYSYEVDDSTKIFDKHVFFEVLKDFGKFSVLSKPDRPKYEEKNTVRISDEVFYYSSPVTPGAMYPGRGIEFSTYMKVTATETIYFANEKGEVEPYIQVITKLVGREWLNADKEKEKVLDKSVLTRYFSEEELTRMRTYAKDNSLGFRSKEDFLKILEFWEAIRSNKH